MMIRFRTEIIINTLVPVLFVALMIATNLTNAQNISKKESRQLDSLNAIIDNKESHDTSIVGAYYELYHILFLYNLDTVIPLVSKIEEIAKKYLESISSFPLISGEEELTQKDLSSNSSFIVQQNLLSYLTNALSDKGYAYHIRGDLKYAIQYYLESLNICREILEQQQKNIVVFPEKSDSIHERMVQVQKGIAIRLGNLGSVYKSIGDIKKAITYFDQCLEIQEELNDQKGMAVTLSNIGSLYSDQGYTKEALNYYYKSLRVLKELDEELYTSVILNNIGHSYLKQNNYKKALDIFSKSLKIQEELDDRIYIASTINNIGTCYLERNDPNYEKALDYFFRSLAVVQQTKNKTLEVTLLGNIGTTYRFQNKLEKAENYLLHGLEIAKEIDLPESIMGAAKVLYEMYNEMNKSKEALSMHKLYTTMKDSLNNLEIQRELSQREIRQEIEKKEQELVQANKENKLKSKQLKLSTIVYGLVLFILILSGSIGFWYYKNRHERNLHELRVLKEQWNKNKKELDSSTIPIKLGNKIKLIALNEIVFFNSKDKYVFVNLRDNKSFIVDYTLKKLEHTLPKNFVRVHNSYLLNTNEISEIIKGSKSKVNFVLKNNPNITIPSSLGYAENVAAIKRNIKI